MKLIVLIIVFCVQNLKAQDEEGVLCSARFCADYIDANPCKDLPDECTIQNATYNGIMLPSPDPCNCCQHCLVNLKESEYCAVGEEGGIVPDSICGPGLECVNGTCVRMNARVNATGECSASQYDFDTRRQEGRLGEFEKRPNCDDDGLYEPYDCMRGLTCFCVDKKGTRIFGEIPYTTTAFLSMKCECSRKYHDAVDFLGVDYLHPNQHFRCAENGDYDTIQCLTEEKCLCVDAQDGAPTYPTAAFVNGSLISNKTLPCFDKNKHQEGQYRRPCEAKYIEILEEVEAYKKDGYSTVFEVEYPSCDLDGTYAAVQKNSKMAYCTDPNGKQIGSYSADLTEFTNMNCYCARASLLLPKDQTEKPDCCPNGNFNKVQCKRGTCYCVDENGRQKTDEQLPFSEKESLSCYENSC